MRIHYTLALALSLTLVQLVLSKATDLQTKQTTAAGLLGGLSNLGSMMLATTPNMLPIVFMFSLGALLVPTLGLNSLLRDTKLRSLPAFGLDTTAFMQSVQEAFDKFNQAIDRMDQKLNK